MPNLDDLKSSFAQKLDALSAQHASRLEAELQELRDRLLREVEPCLPEDVARQLGRLDERLKERRRQAEAMGQPVVSHTRLEIGGSAQLEELDALFDRAFDLSSHYPNRLLNYPTIYCETLEEFFTPLINLLDISAEARQVELRQKVEQARQFAEGSNGGGIFGYNLPGQGCYLNGWLFVYGRNLPPRQAFQTPHLLQNILQTAIHEKLGHGFISAYSTLGAVKTSLGLTLADLARRFDLLTADDPLSSLRREQANLLYLVSQLLEEGWATWVETYLEQLILGAGQHPRHRLQAVIRAIEDLPRSIQDRRQVQGALMSALNALFTPDEIPFPVLHQAVMTIAVLGGSLDAYFTPTFGQPLRYAVGELLLTQAEMNLGERCLPYVVLVAANVSFDPSRFSLTDLRELFGREARLNPDFRLTALSRIHLEAENSIRELVQRAEIELSFTVPPELKTQNKWNA